MLLNKFGLIWAAEDDNGGYLDEPTVIILNIILSLVCGMLIILIYVWPRYFE